MDRGKLFDKIVVFSLSKFHMDQTTKDEMEMQKWEALTKIARAVEEMAKEWSLMRRRGLTVLIQRIVVDQEDVDENEKIAKRLVKSIWPKHGLDVDKFPKYYKKGEKVHN